MADRRLKKVNVNIQRILSSLINIKLQGNNFSPVISVTQVKVSPDFAIAKIYISIMGDEDSVKFTFKALKDNSKMLRRELSEDLYLKKIPKLIFYLDKTLDRVEKMNKLFEQIEVAQE